MMNVGKIAATTVLLAGIASLLFSGCQAGGNIKRPDPHPDFIKVYETVSVHANWPYAKKTGIVLEEGDLYSIIVTGQVNTNPKIFPDRWERFGRLHMMLDNNYYGVSPIHRTTESRHRGEIKFYVWDGHFDHRRGRAMNPDWYRRNRGKFEVTIIIWRKKDWDFIGEFFARMKTLNPENDVVSNLAAQTERYRKVYLSELETAREVAIIRQQIDALRQSSVPVTADGTASPPEAMGSSALAASSKTEGQASEITALESKLAGLMATLNQLEETKKQLAAEREKSARLTEKLEARQAAGSPGMADRYPPFVIVASPRDGQKTSAAAVSLAGVVEDNQGLKRIDILVNDRALRTDRTRGLKVTDDQPARRLEFNQKIPIVEGANRIMIRATDTSGQVTEKIFVVHKEARRRNAWAVVIGIDRDPNFPGLKYAVNDARAFYQLLVENNRIPAENITLLTGEKATATRLRSLLGTKLKQNAGREDMVIIYYAGHGATERDAMSPDGDGLEKYILPHDADPRDLYASALPMREISYILNRIQSERLVFIADACYSGASGGRTVSIEGIRANLSDGFLSRIASGKGRVIITASGANEISLEDDSLRHGVFTPFLIEGLKGHADYDADGLITVDEAYRFVSATVPGATAQGQHPVKKGAVRRASGARHRQLTAKKACSGRPFYATSSYAPFQIRLTWVGGRQEHPGSIHIGPWPVGFRRRLSGTHGYSLRGSKTLPLDSARRPLDLTGCPSGAGRW